MKGATDTLQEKVSLDRKGSTTRDVPMEEEPMSSVTRSRTNSVSSRTTALETLATIRKRVRDVTYRGR